MPAITKAELQAQLAKLERALAREKKRKEDTEALALARDAQAATAEILRVIRRSPSDVQPVFEAIADAAMRLFNAWSVIVVRFDGSQIQYGAARGARRGSEARLRAMFPQPLSKATTIGPIGRCIIGRKIIELADTRRDRSREMRELAEARGFRSTLAVPLMNAKVPIGAIAVTRVEAGRYTRAEIGLLKTFADQAVIAIENTRAFHETREALERQTATADILKVISGSPDDVQPVFDAVARSSMRLLGALSASVSIRVGDTLQLGAFTSTSKAGDQAVKNLFPLSLKDNRDTILAQSVLKAAPAQVGDAQGNRRRPGLREVARRRGFQSIIAVPMLSKGVAIGTLSITRREAGGFSDHEVELLTTFADQAVIAIENVRLFNETREALERQTATAEILGVIASSPTNAQPVFDVIVERAVRLCGARFGRVYRYDEATIHMVASVGLSANGLAQVRGVFPRPAANDTVVGQVILSRAPRFVADIQHDDTVPELSRQMIAALDTRSQVTVPMLRAGQPIGAITMGWDEPSAYDERKVTLLRIFADQAAIAIENVRLFNETREALERQTASAEVLQVISGSLADTRPVFEVILQSCERLFKGRHVGITLVGEDGLAHVGAYHGPAAEIFRDMYPLPINRETGTGLAIIERRTLHYPDTEGGTEVPESIRRGAGITGLKSVVMTPLLGKDRPIGAMFVGREFVGAFSDNEIALIKTFADQAVIAIENARLFNETKEALERQTATAEILKVISQSPTDVQPVFDMIGKLAGKLCAADMSAVSRFDGEKMQLVALEGVAEDGVALIRRAFPMYPGEETVIARAFHNCDVEHVADVMADPSYARKSAARAGGYRGCLGVPMIREGKVIGVIFVARVVPGYFADSQVALLRTFADQAVIAIENVRLFNETKEALERQTATAEILRVISSTPTDTQPVFEAIVNSTQRLIAGQSTVLLLRRDAQFTVSAYAGPEIKDLPEDVRVAPLDRDKNFPSRAILDAEIVHVPDWEGGDDIPEHERIVGEAFGIKSALMVPLLREGQGIGAIAVTRGTPGRFDDKVIALLRSFADQAVIAIENVRLFNETKEALERQTATAEILKVISGSPTDTQPVFEAIVSSAVRLCDAVYSAAITLEGGMLHLVATCDWPEKGLAQARRLFPMPVERDHLSAIAVRENRVIHQVNLQEDPDVPASSRELAVLTGYQALLIVPMVREGRSQGLVVVARKNAFTDDQIALLQTFADQAVIAIDNVRLFNETRDALERQTATAEILGVIASSPSNVQPVFDAIVRAAARLCDGRLSTVLRFDGEFLDIVAHQNLGAEGLAMYRSVYPTPLARDTVAGCAILDRTVINLPDAQEASVPAKSRDLAMAANFRSVLVVPMLREGEPIGIINVARASAGLFSQVQVDLLKTFADQAVIAIENVRLFNETKEALEQQRASGEVLSVISNSIADAQPVFEKIVESCERLFTGSKVGLNLVGPDGMVHAGAYGNFPGVDKLRTEGFPHPATAESATGAAILARDAIHYPDALGGPNVPFYARRGAQVVGFRSFIMAPLLSEGRGLGAIFVGRETAGSFTEKEIALLKTFADQAVIAIQNARLFNETKEALERQTATAEILEVISESPTDVQPVFDAIVQSCMRLFGGMQVALNMAHGNAIDRVAYSVAREAVDATADVFPMPLNEASIAGRAMLRGELVHLENLSAADWISEGPRSIFRRTGYRSALCAPMLREGKAIGAIIVFRQTTGRFKDAQIALLRTFADQAVIAIENVRLFKELQERTQALTRSVGQLTALGEVSQALSSTLDVEKVLQTIASRAVQLTGLDGAAIYEYDEARKVFTLRGGENIMPELVDLYRREPIRFGESAVGGAAAKRAPVQIADIVAQGYESRARDVLERAGARALLAVPLLREGNIIGAIAVIRNRPGEFAAEVIDLLQTFATQSAIAIQNARLFREIEEKGRQLEEASQHKSHFLASMSHELRTPLNAILGFNEMILGEVYGEVPGDMKEPLEDIQTSGKHLLRLINNVLDLAKIEAGRMELALADYSVQDMVESVRATLRPLAESKGLEFLVSVPNDMPLAHGDSGRMTQCLMNLAGNSLKFTKQGNVSIAVEPHGELLRFRVADTGIGIPPDKIDSLFTEFKQTDATIASEYGGTGLGLAITKQFIEMHGGRIWVESELGKGSAFIFEIPLRAEAGAAA